MADNVFGDPITDSTLRNMPEYKFKKVISRKDRAAVARSMQHKHGNDVKVRHYVEKVAKDSKSHIATLCVVYNATGDTVRYVGSHNWFDGHLAGSPYPISIENGQWGGFVHVKPDRRNAGSHGAVVYRGRNQTGSECSQGGHECDWMVTWENPYNVKDYHNSVHTQVREKGHFHGDVWGKVWETKSGKRHLVQRDTWNGCVSSASTGSGHIAVVEAVFTLEHA